MSIHGGPSWQDKPVYLYDGLYQYLVSRGVAVFAPNVRDSTGYGKTYRDIIQRDWGGGDLRDFADAVAYLRSLGWVDPRRVGVFGASYGGFGVLSCLSRLPDPRVPQSESDQIVERLRARGVEVRYEVFPEEGHGLTKRENQARAFTDVGEFLVGHLTS